jgi:hypothetical protein
VRHARWILAASLVLIVGAAGLVMYKRTSRYCVKNFTRWVQSCNSRTGKPSSDGFNIAKIAEASHRTPEFVNEYLNGGCQVGTLKRPDVSWAPEVQEIQCGAQAVACSWIPDVSDSELGGVCENGEVVRLSVLEIVDEMDLPKCRQCQWPQRVAERR